MKTNGEIISDSILTNYDMIMMLRKDYFESFLRNDGYPRWQFKCYEVIARIEDELLTWMPDSFSPSI